MNIDADRPVLAPRRDEASDVALLVQPLWHGQPVGECCWRRIETAGSQVAQFVPEVCEAAPDASTNEDHAQLPLLRLFAHGTAPGHGAPVGPFELQNLISGRTCAVNGRLMQLGRREPLKDGDEVQVGMLRLSFVGPRVLEECLASTAQVLCGTHACESGLDVRAIPENLFKGSDTSGTGDEETEMFELHRRYHATLGDPAEVGAQVSWREAVWAGPAAGPGPDPLDALRQRSNGYASLHDMLTEPDSMNTLIARADALGEGDLLADVRVESVLHLFAPPSARAIQTGKDSWLAELERPETGRSDQGLSSLTRREHHLPAADSALRLNDCGEDRGRD